MVVVALTVVLAVEVVALTVAILAAVELQQHGLVELNCALLQNEAACVASIKVYGQGLLAPLNFKNK